MHLEPKIIQVITMSPTEYENMPEDQRERVQEIKRKDAQRDSMLTTFVTKYTGETPKHRTLDDIIKKK